MRGHRRIFIRGLGVDGTLTVDWPMDDRDWDSWYPFGWLDLGRTFMIERIQGDFSYLKSLSLILDLRAVAAYCFWSVDLDANGYG